MTQPTINDFTTTLPWIVLSVWACLLLLVDLFIPKGRKGVTALLAALGLMLSLGINLAQIGLESVGFSGMVVRDGFAAFANTLLLLSGLFGVALAYGYVRRMGIERGEYYTLLLFSACGMMLMAQAADLIIVFLALELLSIPLYVLAAFARGDMQSQEAGVKYFLLGAFATGFVVYGTALVFGATGTTSLGGIFAAASGGTPGLMFTIGAALILVGFGFKVAAVPFHMWTPDVYQGAPSAATAFMSSGAKVAGFVALLRVFSTSFPALASDMSGILWALSALTMIVGNLVAIAQTNIKRMLAYSSIAHAGYILMAFVSYGNPQAASASIASGMFYLLAYTLTNFGAWSVVIALEKRGKGLEIAEYAGVARKHPALAAAMAVFMLSFIGFPPTLGIVGKFYLFRAAIAGGYTGLALIGVLTSLVSAYYYLRVVVNMYMREGDLVPEREPWLGFTAALTAVATVALSLVPQWMFLLAGSAVMR